VVVVAAGGTGGHIFPGIAVADALCALAQVRIVFFGTRRGLESRVVPAHGYPLEFLQVEPLKGRNPLNRVRSVALAARETLKGWQTLGRLRPAAVLSVGGYAAGPISLAAATRGVPVAVLEPNSTPGLTNRLLAPVAREIYGAWDGPFTQRWSGKTKLFGVPLRKAFETPLPRRPGALRVLVLGGSLGATALNERLPEALARVRKRVPEVTIVHQAGAGREATVQEAYGAQGVARDVQVLPFLEDVAQAMADADVIVARAGAVTLAELKAVGRPSILIPFPYAADDHQGKNAEALQALGGALCVRQDQATPDRLATELERLLSDGELRARMGKAARSEGRPEAATEVAKALLRLAHIELSASPPLAMASALPHGSGAHSLSNGIAKGEGREVG
jgi:UDP-N-acetylglucosamine--N-acetylmuramyl-(pentapeptide) pyrophosphoryl-undecaprenol N-acetylglucosamine transferase